MTDGADSNRLEALRDALDKEGAELAIVAPKIGGPRLKSGKRLPADMALSGAPSVFFDAVVIFASAEGIKPLLKNSAAVDWVRDAFGHLKVIGQTAAAHPLFVKAGIADDLDEGVIELDARASIGQYIEAAKQQRVWDRESASQKATHQPGQRSAGVRRGYLAFRRTRFDSQATFAAVCSRSRGKGVCARQRL